MVASNKPLTIDDPRLNEIKKRRLPVFRINDRTRVFTWENMPRHKLPYATISIEQFKNKTASEIAAYFNRLLSNGGEIPGSLLQMGKKKAEQKAEIVIDTSPKIMRHVEVDDWEKPVEPPLSNFELKELLGIE